MTRRAGTLGAAFWAAAGILLLLCLSPLLYSSSGHGTATGTSHYHRRHAADRGPAHRNPTRTPPEYSLALARAQAQAQAEAEAEARANISSSSVDFGLSARSSSGLAKRDALRCDDGPCIDGSCCGKDHICGFGPDFCGDGCLSQCDAKAMCGEHSENGEMPCGMKLCCSASGWCGVR
jgi:chitinase